MTLRVTRSRGTPALFGTKARSNIHIRGVDQVAQRCGVDLATRMQFHVPHAFARALQQARGVVERCTVEEADVDMGCVRVDISEGSVRHACGWLVVMHHFAHIITTAAHYVEPVPRDSAEFIRLLVQPGSDYRIAPGRPGEPKDLIHCESDRLPAAHRRAPTWRPRFRADSALVS